MLQPRTISATKVTTCCTDRRRGKIEHDAGPQCTESGACEKPTWRGQTREMLRMTTKKQTFVEHKQRHACCLSTVSTVRCDVKLPPPRTSTAGLNLEPSVLQIFHTSKTNSRTPTPHGVNYLSSVGTPPLSFLRS